MLVDQLHEAEQRAHGEDGDPGARPELGDHDHHQHGTGAQQTDRVDDAGPLHPTPLHGVGLDAQQPGPVSDHPDLAQREADEHAHDVQLDQRGHLGAERHHEGDRREREEEDAVGERQPVTAGVQLARQVPVLSEDRTEDRESVEGRVGGQHEDQRGHTGNQVQADREVVEHRVGQLGDQRLGGDNRRARRRAGPRCRRPWPPRFPWPTR